MTLLASWAAIDSRKVASIYIVSDSRISWKGNGKFDAGKKVFACKKSPDIFGYCGDVLFPLMVLGQIVSAIDAGLMFQSGWTYRQKCCAIIRRFKNSFNDYPHEVKNIMADSFEIIYGTRDDNSKEFYCLGIKWVRKTHKWSYSRLPMEKYSYQLRVTGSGSKEFKSKYNEYVKNISHRTSRAMYQTFCDTLFNIKDKTCGGAPQLVGLYSKPYSPGREYGIIYKNKRYFGGLQIDNFPKKNWQNVEWRNEMFEICDPKTKQRKTGAQKQTYDIATPPDRSNK